MTWRERLAQDGFRGALQELLEAYADWADRQPLSKVLPREEIEAKLGELRDEVDLDARYRQPFEKSWDNLWKKLRAVKKAPKELIGEEIAQALIDGVAEMEPNEEAVRAFFQQKAVSELLGTLLFDGIKDFLDKMNPLNTVVKESLQGIPFASTFSSGLLGKVARNFERTVDRQLKTFLTGFSKVAMERAAKFVLAEANRKMFRDMRIGLVKKFLGTEVATMAKDLDDERLSSWKEKIWEGFRAELKKPEKRKLWDQRLSDLYEKHGGETPGSLVEKWGIDKAWREEATRAFVPVLHRFFKEDIAADWLSRYIR